MSTKKPATRLAASAPKASAHLSKGQQSALEISEEATHATGKKREKLTKQAVKAAGDKAC